jgi:hypothetical protein
MPNLPKGFLPNNSYFFMDSQLVPTCEKQRLAIMHPRHAMAQ